MTSKVYSSYYDQSVSFGGKELTFSLNEEKATHNLFKLFQRTPGVKFYLKEGKFQEADGLFGRIKAWWQADQIRDVVSETLSSFSIFLSSQRDQKYTDLVQHFFSENESIGRLSSKIFNRDMIRKDDRLSSILLPKNVIRLKIGEAGFYDIVSHEIVDGVILDMSIGNNTLNTNFYRSLHREKGHKYFNSIEEIQGIYEKVIIGIRRYVQRNEMTHTHKIAIKKIFNESAFSRTNGYLFRDAVKHKRESPFRIIKEGSELEKILMPTYQEACDRFQASCIGLRDSGKNDVTLRQFEEALMELVMTEFKFCQILGVDLERISDGGSGGARFAQNRYGNKILVIKPGDEGPHGVNNPQWYAKIKRLIISPRFPLVGNSEPLAEIETDLLDRMFSLYSVPPNELRYVASREFNGKKVKECSVQIFVEGCTTLGKYVGISSKMYGFPRPILRWYAKRKTFDIDGQRKGIEAILPQSSIERVAYVDALSGNLDRHLDNILVKIRPGTTEKSVIERLFSDDRGISSAVTDEEISGILKNFFKNRSEQRVLESLLHSDLNERQERVWCVSIDGGSSCGHDQPNDYLSLRFKHLFEILPQFDSEFQFSQLILGREEQFAKALMESTIQSLRNILEKSNFEAFWKKEENRQLLKSWMFETNRKEGVTKRLKLITALWETSDAKSDKEHREYVSYFKKHLVRIRGNIRTRSENWRILNKFLNQDRAKMRDFFAGVRSESDFRRELFGLDDGFLGKLESWKIKPVKAGEATYSHSENLSMTELLSDFGV